MCISIGNELKLLRSGEKKCLLEKALRVKRRENKHEFYLVQINVGKFFTTDVENKKKEEQKSGNVCPLT